MLQIAAWLERHQVLGHLAGGVAVIGGTWLLVGWLQPARPDTPIAHVYCSIIATGADGRFDPVRADQELDLSKQLAFRHGGQDEVRQVGQRVEAIAAEYRAHLDKGDLAELRRHYQDKCRGY